MERLKIFRKERGVSKGLFSQEVGIWWGLRPGQDLVSYKASLQFILHC